MGRRYEWPTRYRDKECPYCGFYFSPRGLNGHIRFRHPIRKARAENEDPALVAWQEEVGTLMSKIHTDEGLKEALRFFLNYYLTKAKPPKYM